MSTLIVKCIVDNITLVEVDNQTFAQADVDTYRNCKCNINASHQIEALVDGSVVPFSIQPPPNVIAMISSALDADSAFGQSLISQFAAENVVAGFTTSQLDTALDTLAGVLDAMANGYLNIAINRMNIITPDGVVITTARVTEYRNAIQTYLGIPLT
jgi:hypothetical protein